MNFTGMRDADDATPVLAVFYSVFSATLAAGLAYFRHYLGGPGPEVFLLYWLQLVTLLGAVTLGGRHYLLWLVAALSLFLLLGAILCLSLYLLVPLGAAALALIMIRSRGACALPAMAGTVAAVVLGAFFFLTVNAVGAANVLLPERVLTGLALPDTLFHTALSSMLSNYGVLASALSGFQPIRYHAFSHLWLGLMARGAGVNTVHGYYLGLQIVVLPLLLFSVSRTASTLGDVRYRPALLIAVPLALLACFERYDWASYLASESHAVALALVFAGIPFLRSLAAEKTARVDVQAIIALGFAILLSAAKISVGATWTVGVVYLLVRERRLSKWGVAASAALLLLHCLVAVKYILPNDNVATTKLGLLDFPCNYPLVFAVNLAPVLLDAALRMRDWQRRQDRAWHETILLMMLICLLPTLLLRVEGGSAYYFLNVAAWLAIASLSGRLVAGIAPRWTRIALVVCIATIAVMAVLTPQKRRAYRILNDERAALYDRTAPQSSAQLRARPPFDPASLSALQQDIAVSTGAGVGRVLRRNHLMPGTDVMVAVSPSFQAFWKLTEKCNAAAFLVPAYFGVPLLNGLPPQWEQCALGPYYGYSLYGRKDQSRDMDDAQLCRLALADGFHRVMLLQSAAVGRRIDCAKP